MCRALFKSSTRCCCRLKCRQQQQQVPPPHQPPHPAAAAQPAPPPLLAEPRPLNHSTKNPTVPSLKYSMNTCLSCWPPVAALLCWRLITANHADVCSARNPLLCPRTNPTPRPSLLCTVQSPLNQLPNRQEAGYKGLVLSRCDLTKQCKRGQRVPPLPRFHPAGSIALSGRPVCLTASRHEALDSCSGCSSSAGAVVLLHRPAGGWSKLGWPAASQGTSSGETRMHRRHACPVGSPAATAPSPRPPPCWSQLSNA